jgi:flagellar biosynthetic protein FlhB
MAEQKSDLDANEPATQFKLDKARERGSIVRSADATFAVVLTVCVACVYGLGASVIEGVALLCRRALSLASRDDLTQASALAYVGALGGQALRLIAPTVFVLWIAALFAAALQARGVFTAEPLKPDFSRLNPANGIKRIFSLKALHELWKTALKLAVIAMAMTLWGWHHLDDILGLSAQTPRASERSGISLIGSALTLLAGLMIVFAFIDWTLNRWDYLRQMRMSKREIKDEHKEREGDPRIKSRLRELRLAWLKRARQLAKVRSADVLLTNPTHYAVALEYRHGQMPAPMITARGAGEMAQRMRREARRREVPIVENPLLARALFALHESQAFVPAEHFEQVARVLRWVYAARTRSPAAPELP